jgi:lipopolysaccharide assembly outer membrane protein LptD (OstA)
MNAKRASAWCAGVLGAALLAQGAAAQSDSGDSGASNIAGFSHIRTDKVDFNINTGDFTIPGHFTATREGSDITADHATGNSKLKQLHAEGHVVVHQTSAATGSAASGDLSKRPSTLTCDKLDVDGVKKIYYATGNMHFTQEGGREATSDSAVLDETAHHLHMEGHAHVRKDEQIIDANTLDYDTSTGQLEAAGDVTITAPVETASPGTATAPPKKKKRGLPF